MYQGYKKVRLKVDEELDIEFSLTTSHNALKFEVLLNTFELINVNKDSIARLFTYNYKDQERIIKAANNTAYNYIEYYNEQLTREMAGTILYA